MKNAVRLALDSRQEFLHSYLPAFLILPRNLSAPFRVTGRLIENSAYGPLRFYVMVCVIFGESSTERGEYDSRKGAKENTENAHRTKCSAPAASERPGHLRYKLLAIGRATSSAECRSRRRGRASRGAHDWLCSGCYCIRPETSVPERGSNAARCARLPPTTRRRCCRFPPASGPRDAGPICRPACS